MGQINVSLPADGETIEAADYNTPFTTVVNEINGELDNSNIASDAAIAGTKLASSALFDREVNDTAGNEVLQFASTASAVNELTITNAATGNAPSIAATGGDTNINLNLVTKGTGVFQVNGNSPLVFSTSETAIGKWHTGVTLYRKVISLGAGPNSTSKDVAHGISGMTAVINMYGMSVGATISRSLPLSVSTAAMTVIGRVTIVHADNLTWVTSYNATAETGFIVLEYLK